MRIGLMQPYLFPYFGYFQLISIVDKYVIYDDVNYIKGGWINRNSILLNNQRYLFTISLDQASPFKHINEIFIKDDFIKFTRTLFHAYSKAPFFNESMELINNIISFSNRNLGQFTGNSIKLIANYLKIDTEIILSSMLEYNRELKSQEKVIEICKTLQASEYINAIGGQNLYDRNTFDQSSLRLKFLKTNLFTYKQFNNEFVPSLSIIDILMFNSPEQVCELLKEYVLI
jgi:hypothetical protein